MISRGFRTSVSLLALAGALGLAEQAAAQIVTDGTLGAAGAITPTGTVYEIPQARGTTSGQNLFHSFSQFDVPTGTEARFTGAASLQNVISRVTGGDASDIAGRVSLVGPTAANFYLINPAGIVITGDGVNNTFNVPGGLVLSTANELHFADGVSFPIAAVAPSGTLSMAAPESFGFLGATHGSIEAVGFEHLTDDNPGVFHVSAGDVDLTDTHVTPFCDPSICTLANTGDMQVIAVGDGPLQLDLANPDAVNSGGSVTVTDSSLTAGAGQMSSRDVTIRGDSVSFTTTHIIADVQTGSDVGNISVEGGSIELNDGNFRTSTAGSGAAGDIRIVASRDIRIHGGALIASDAAGGGPGGNILIEAPSIVIESPDAPTTPGETVRVTSVSAATFGTIGGPAGSITLRAPGGSIRILGVSRVDATTSQTASDAGSIFIEARTFEIDGAGGLQAWTRGPGDAGDITITASESVRLSRGAGIASQAGFIFPRAPVVGNSGTILISAPSIVLDSAGVIISSDADSGTVGTITLRAPDGSIRLSGGSVVRATSLNANPAGTISLIAGDFSLNDSTIASTNTFASGGAAGSVTIEADSISLLNGASVTTDSTAGAAGDITLVLPRTGVLSLIGPHDPAVITTSSGVGAGGRITISDPFAIFANGSSILALGQAGGANVNITSDFFIRSFDSTNLLSVDGTLLLDSQVQDVSQGAETAELVFLDASSVLAGQCPGARLTGEVSRLGMARPGPYARPARPVVSGGGVFASLADLQRC
jgi:filamentous hemagglutinin family protein